MWWHALASPEGWSNICTFVVRCEALTTLPGLTDKPMSHWRPRLATLGLLGDLDFDAAVLTGFERLNTFFVLLPSV